MNSDLSDPTMSIQAKILFSLSITLSMVQLIMGVMMLFLKYALLKKVAEEEERKREKEEKEEEEENEDRHMSSSLEIGNLYASNDGVRGVETGSIQRVENPMHSAAMGTIAELREKISKLEEELRQHQSHQMKQIEQEPTENRSDLLKSAQNGLSSA